jgi:hypothetical protein
MNIDEIRLLKCQIKLDLINYFDAIKSEIDICAFNVLKDIESSLSTNKSDVLDNVYKLNQEMIDIVNKIYENNTICVNDFFQTLTEQEKLSMNNLNKNDIKRFVLNGYCFYINIESLKHQFRDGNLLGLLIISDFYLDENLLNFLRLVQHYQVIFYNQIY